MESIDGTDLRILEILQRDARTPIEALARQIGLTKTPAASRIRKLEERGVIQKYGARLNPEMIGLPVAAFLAVTLTSHSEQARKEFAQKVCALPNVLECHFITGETDVLLKVRVTSIADYQRDVIDMISRSGRVATMVTSIVMSTLKEDGALPLPPPSPSAAKKGSRTQRV